MGLFKVKRCGQPQQDEQLLCFSVDAKKMTKTEIDINLCRCYGQTQQFGYVNKRKRYRIQKEQSKNEQSRETGNIEYTRRRKTKQRHNTICVGHHYTQTYIQIT